LTTIYCFRFDDELTTKIIISNIHQYSKSSKTKYECKEIYSALAGNYSNDIYDYEKNEYRKIKIPHKIIVQLITYMSGFGGFQGQSLVKKLLIDELKMDLETFNKAL
ncbi:MAG: hypothetical protein ACRC6U_00550, partial [Fusobacteriaceae bacterium]